MKNRMKAFIIKIENILKQKDPNLDYEEIIKDMLIQIKFFQHERLVHFLVTSLFASMEIVTICFTVCYRNELFFLALGILILLVPYVSYYYFIENKTQYCYHLYDEMLQLKNDFKKKEKTEETF